MYSRFSLKILKIFIIMFFTICQIFESNKSQKVKYTPFLSPTFPIPLPKKSCPKNINLKSKQPNNKPPSSPKTLCKISFFLLKVFVSFGTMCPHSLCILFHVDLRIGTVEMKFFWHKKSTNSITFMKRKWILKKSLMIN